MTRTTSQTARKIQSDRGPALERREDWGPFKVAPVYRKGTHVAWGGYMQAPQ